MSKIDYLQSPFYFTNPLDTDAMSDDPVEEFECWYRTAEQIGEQLPNGMVLSTVTEQNQPDSRVVLMKHFSSAGVLFFTNYNSQKGQQLTHNANVSLLFWWKKCYRQVRIKGQAKKLTADQSKDYFSTRDRQSQIGAIVSPQSQSIESRVALENRIEKFAQEFHDTPLQCPDYWGGYCVEFNGFEFWHAGEHRLHDRVVYTLQNGSWRKQRLAP